MLKSLQKGLTKFFTTDKVILFVVIAILGFAIYNYGLKKDLIRDNMEGEEKKPEEKEGEEKKPETSLPSYDPKDTAAPADLLPKDENEAFGNKKANVMAPDVLDAGYHIGLDTVGQSMRNANQQIRPDPVISKADVGPWNNSTIEADTSRAPL
tara:strand:+ start:441 stop:899 length:459 start_codon:yes stop_codon:yes gene_type:complete